MKVMHKVINITIIKDARAKVTKDDTHVYFCKTIKIY